ncbi:MAG TPA: DUF6326 family protein [Holophagaceae bacterium]|nr:DUF6326 family protein [Holophagaceae bacterium]
MTASDAPKPVLQDTKVDTRIKLAALWAATTLCYLYGDYFDLYRPGKLGGMLEGRMPPLGPVTQGVLLGTSILMAIPSLMVALSVLLRPGLSRWANILFGAVFSLIMALAIQGTWTFYKFFGLVEIALTLTIVWIAWRWPRTA